MTILTMVPISLPVSA